MVRWQSRYAELGDFQMKTFARMVCPLAPHKAQVDSAHSRWHPMQEISTTEAACVAAVHFGIQIELFGFNQKQFDTVRLTQ